ncbi:MAG: hypothetical protein RL087_1878, partial [Pseudomonadota bacterium]
MAGALTEPHSPSALADAVRRALGAEGALSQADFHHRERQAQQAMAEAVCTALEARSALVVEAGTGVGKTFAYLVPLLLSGGRAMVSTATKSLQDQLFLRDLPRLKAALAAGTRVALLKGRASYLCLHRLKQARSQAELPDRWSVRLLGRIEQWAHATRTGDLAEVEGLDDRSAVIPLVTSTRDNCLGAECPDFSACHVVRARREAMAADLVVVNHHLFFADIALRDSGVAELLPTVDAVVFDEAHQLVEAGLDFLGTTLSTHAAQDFCRDLLGNGLSSARGLQPWPDLAAAVDRAGRDLRLACVGAGPAAASGRRPWRELQARPAVADALKAMAEAAASAARACQAVEGASPDFSRLAERAGDLARIATAFAAPVPPGRVRWADHSTHSVRLVESPLDIREPLTAQRALSAKAWVFTSATLGDDDALTWFTSGTGLEDAARLRLGSPFDYPEVARIWVPRPMPRPQAPEHPEAVAAIAARCASRLGGRTFVLTTTLRVLPRLAQALERELMSQSPRVGGWQVLTQGSQPRRVMLQAWGDGQGKVLVGSHSFWEGID